MVRVAVAMVRVAAVRAKAATGELPREGRAEVAALAEEARLVR